AVTRGLAPGRTFDVAITGVAEDEWHIYSVTQGPGGPVPTTIAIPRGGMFTRNGAIRGPVPATAFDPNFEIRTETYDGTFTLVLPLRLAPDARATSATLQVEVGFQACTNRLCLPPKTITLDVPVRWVVVAARLEVAPAVPAAAPPEPKAAGATATPGPP